MNKERSQRTKGRQAHGRERRRDNYFSKLATKQLLRTKARKKSDQSGEALEKTRNNERGGLWIGTKERGVY